MSIIDRPLTHCTRCGHHPSVCCCGRRPEFARCVVCRCVRAAHNGAGGRCVTINCGCSEFFDRARDPLTREQRDLVEAFRILRRAEHGSDGDLLPILDQLCARLAQKETTAT